MNWLDVLLVAALGLGAWKGLRAGLSGQIATLIAVVAGYVTASQAQLWGTRQLSRVFNSAVGSRILAFIILFCLGYLITRFILNRFLEKILGPNISLGNRLAGGVTALVKASILLSFPLILWILFLPESSFSTLSQSRVFPYLKPALGFSLNFLPKDLQEAYDKRVGDLDDFRYEQNPGAKPKTGDRAEPGEEKSLYKRDTLQLKDRRKIEELIEKST